MFSFFSEGKEKVSSRLSLSSSLEDWRSSVFAHPSAVCATLVYIKVSGYLFLYFPLFLWLTGRWKHCHTVRSISTGRIQPVRSQSPRTQAADDDRYPHADLTETIALRQVKMMDLPRCGRISSVLQMRFFVNLIFFFFFFKLRFPPT